MTSLLLAVASLCWTMFEAGAAYGRSRRGRGRGLRPLARRFESVAAAADERGVLPVMARLAVAHVENDPTDPAGPLMLAAAVGRMREGSARRDGGVPIDLDGAAAMAEALALGRFTINETHGETRA